MNKSAGNSIDNKVVSLEFQNKSFEENAKKTLSTIDLLKKALNFPKTVSTSALDGIVTGANLGKEGIKGLTNAVGQLNTSLSTVTNIAAFSMIADEAIKAKDAVKDFIKSVTIDQATAGWDKYAQKTEAVQTIMAATAKDWDDQSKQIEFVNAQLEKLNWFTDETSYNFVDMTNNIGKFTSNQIPLEQSVTAMQGISTWAAKSGAKVEEAGRAMYNLSQAIGVGSVKLMDWKSIENANMGTAEFKETAIQTAEALGTLTKAQDGVWKTTKGNEVSVKNFNEALKDEWFTSEVLLGTLDKYGSFTDKLYSYMNEVDLDTTSQLLGLIEDYKDGTIKLDEEADKAGVTTARLKEILEDLGSSEMDFGRKAFAAAQEATTFAQAIEATKDAASTAWLNVFETIFGDYLSAKGLWTDMANFLYDVFVPPVTDLQELLEGAFTTSDIATKADFDKLVNSGLASPEYLSNLRKNATEHGVKIAKILSDEEWLDYALSHQLLTTTELQGAFENLGHTEEDLGEVNQELKSSLENALKDRPEEIQAILDKLDGHGLEDLNQVVFGDGSYSENAKDLEESLDQLLNTLGLSQDAGEDLKTVLRSMGYFANDTGKSIMEMSASELAAMGYRREQIAIIQKGKKEGKELSEIMEDLGVNTTTGMDHWLSGIHNVMDSITALKEVFSDAWSEFFPETEASSVYNLLKSFDEGAASLSNFIQTSDTLHDVFTAIASVADIVVSHLGVIAKGGAFGAVIKLTGALLGFLKSITAVGVKIGVAAGAFEFIRGFIEGLGIDFGKLTDDIAKLITAFNAWFKAADPINKMLGWIRAKGNAAGAAVRKWIDAFLALPIVQKGIKQLKTAFESFTTGFSAHVEEGKTRLEGFTKKVEEMGGINLDNVGDVFEMAKDELIDWIKTFPGVSEAIEGLGALWDGLKVKLREAGVPIDEIESTIIGLGKTVTTVFGGILKLGFNLVVGILKLWDSFTKLPVVQAAIKNFGEAFTVMGKTFGPFMDGLADRISGFFEKVDALGGFKIENFGKIFDIFKTDVLDYITSWDGFKAIGDAFKGFWNDAFASLGENETLMAAWDKVKNIINAIKETFKGVKLPSSFDEIPQFLQSLRDAIAGGRTKGSGGGITGKIFDMIMVFFDKVIALVQFVLSHWKLVLAIVSVGLLIRRIKGIFDDIHEYFNAMTKKAKAQAFMMTAIGVVALAGAIWIVAMTFKDLAQTFATDQTSGWLEKIAPGLLSIIAVLGMMALVFTVVGKMDVKPGTAWGVAAAVAAVWVVAQALMGLANGLDKGDFKTTMGHVAPALLAMTVIFAGLAGLFAIVGKMDPGAGTTWGIAATMAAFWVVAKAFEEIAKIDRDNLHKAELALGILTGCLAGLMVVAHFSKIDPKTMLSIAAVMAVMGIVLASMAHVAKVNPEGMEAAVDAITHVMLWMTLLVAAAGVLKPSMGVLITLGVIIGLVAGIVIALDKIVGVEKTVAIAETMSKLFGSIALMMAAIAGVGLIGLSGIGAGLLSLLGTIAIIALVVGGIGALVTAFPQVGNWIDTGIPILERLIDVLCNAIKKIISAIMDAVFGDRSPIQALADDVAYMAEVFGGDEFKTNIEKIGEIDINGQVAANLGKLALITLIGAILGLIESLTSLLSGYMFDKTGIELVVDDIAYLATTFGSSDFKTNIENIGNIDIGGDVGANLTKLALVDIITNALGLGTSIASIPSKVMFDRSAVQQVVDDLTYMANNLGGDKFKENLEAIGKIDISDDVTGNLASFSDMDIMLAVTGLFSGLASIVTELTEGRSAAEQMVDDLTYVADELTDPTFQENLVKLGVFKIPEQAMTNLKNFEQIDVMVALSGFVSGISSMATEIAEGNSAAEQVTKDLALIAEKFSDETFQTNMESIGDINVPTDKITQLTEALKTVSVQGFMDALLDFFNLSEESNLEQFAEDAKQLSLTLIRWSAAMDQLEKMGGMTVPEEEIGQLQKSIETVSKQEGGLFGAISTFVAGSSSLDDFETNAGKLGDAIAAFTNSVSETNLEKMKAAASTAEHLATITNFVESIAINPEYVGNFEEAMGTIGRSFNGFVTMIDDPDAAIGAGEAAATLIDGIHTLKDVKLGDSDIMDETLVSEFEKNIDRVRTIIEGLSDLDITGVNRLKGAVGAINSTDIETTAKKNLDGASDVASDAGTSSGSEYSKQFANSIDSSESKKAVSTMMSDVLSAADTSEFATKGFELVRDFAKGIRGTSLAYMAVQDMMRDASSALDGYYDEFRLSGKYVAEGFSNGMIQATVNVTAAAYRIAMAAKNRIKEVFNINSPSKEMIIMGQYVGEGLAIGMLNRVNEVASAGGTLAESVGNGINRAIGVINNAINTEITGDPVIRPVLDLTEIQNGAGSISSILTSMSPIDPLGNYEAISSAVEARRQQASLDDVVRSLNSVEQSTSSIRSGDTYNVNGITYDDGSNITDAIKTLTHAVLTERRR